MKSEVKNSFYRAIEKDDVQTVRRMLRGSLFQKPIDPNKTIQKQERTDRIRSAVERENITPLGVAIDSGCLEIVRLLVESGADVNTNTSDTWSKPPILQAIQKGYIDIAMYLLEAGANPKDSLALYYASYHGSVELADRLISKGAELDGNTMSEHKPMQGAILGRSLRVTELLISKGAKVDVHFNRDLLLLAVKMKQTEMLSILLDHIIINARTWARDSIIREAMSNAIKCSIMGIFFKDNISTERCSPDDWHDILEILTNHQGGVLRCGIEKSVVQSEFDIYRQPKQTIPAWVSEKAKADAKIDEVWEIWKVCGWHTQEGNESNQAVLTTSTLGYREAVLLPLSFLQWSSKVLKTFYVIAYFNTDGPSYNSPKPILHYSVVEHK